jgi:hypothetical protein
MTVNKESLANLIKAVESGKPLGEAEKAALAEISEKAKNLEKPNSKPEPASVSPEEKNENSPASPLAEKAELPSVNPELSQASEASDDVLQLLKALQEASLYDKDSRSSDQASALLESLTK